MFDPRQNMAPQGYWAAVARQPKLQVGENLADMFRRRKKKPEDEERQKRAASAQAIAQRAGAKPVVGY